MKTTRILQAVFLAVVCALAVGGTSARQGSTVAVAIDGDDIGGVVSGPKGPEAGVWVIAETTELPTRFVRIVVTDDGGRYLLPDLPKASYTVWVRGYGLIDSPKTTAHPGKALNLTAVPAPDPRAAAEIYPSGYWLSLLKVPEKSEFPGGAGIGQNVKNQADWIRLIKSGGCTACHQLGTTGTRKLPKEFERYASSVLAWERRLQSGQPAPKRTRPLGKSGPARRSPCFAAWPNLTPAAKCRRR